MINIKAQRIKNNGQKNPKKNNKSKEQRKMWCLNIKE